MDKSPEAFRTISEVSELLETPAHVLRFWETRFPQIRPVKRAGGRRYYRPGDVALLTGIKRLLHEDGMTIRGVQKLLREQGIRHVSGLTDDEGAGFDVPRSDSDDLAQTTAAALAALRPNAAPLAGSPAAEGNIIAFPIEPSRDDPDMANTESARASDEAPDPDQEFFPGFAPSPEEEAAMMLLEPLEEEPAPTEQDAPSQAAKQADNIPEAPFIDISEEEAETADLATFARPAPLRTSPSLSAAALAETASAPARQTESPAPAAAMPRAESSPESLGAEKSATQAPSAAMPAREITADQTLAARIRALPPGALAAKKTEIMAILARLAALRARIAQPNGGV